MDIVVIQEDVIVYVIVVPVVHVDGGTVVGGDVVGGTVVGGEVVGGNVEVVVVDINDVNGDPSVLNLGPSLILKFFM